MNEYINKLTIPCSDPVFNALVILNNADIHCRIILVVDLSGSLVGTVTDGDIRRGLISGLEMSMPISAFMKQDFFHIYQGEDIQHGLDKAKNLNIEIIPILDKQKKVVDLVSAQNSLQYLGKRNSVLIMAGGKGTRLKPFTETCPKPMLKVGEKPMLEIIIKQYIDAGFTKFYLSVNYLKEKIIDYFGDGKRWNISIDYLEENLPLGTAGSVGLITQQITEPLLVTNGDVLTHFSPDMLLQFHKENNACATIGARYVQTQIQYGVITVENMQLHKFNEKPTMNYLVNAGVYVLNADIIKLINDGESLDMPDLLLRAKSHGHKIYVCPIHEEWLDVGRPHLLERAQTLWG